MSATSPRVPWFSAATLRGDFFPWVLAVVTGLDYFDNAIFSFFTSYIAGGINASPDELVWASSACGVGAVLGILQQQWWVGRFGYRRYVAGCMLLYSVGAIAATLCESSIELAFARGFQGYFIGPMMGTCRILIQMSFTPQQRPAATRAFLVLIVLSSALAPLIGGQLVAHFDWRALFACTAPVGVLFAILALHALREKVFQVGLVLYMFYYYISTVFSYLTSRFLESGLGYPVENAGRLVGVTSLISASALFVYLRYAKLLPRKKWVIVPGFAVAAFAAAWMTRMSPAVGEAALIVPLLLRGLLLLFIVLPVAKLTFRIFAIEEFTHGYRLKNIVRQLTISFATASVIIVEQHRQALHQA